MNTLLIVGFGDIAKRALALLAEHFRVAALVRPERMAEAPAFSAARFIAGDLDDPAGLAQLVRGFSHVVHLAPPPIRGTADPRTTHLLGALAVGRLLPQRLVYISTSGVYGDCGGEWVDERRPVNPLSDRARRRVKAERSIVAFGSAHGVRTVVLRVPGIYAADRMPLERLRKGTPALRTADDVYTNHIHAEDLVHIVATALTHPDAAGVYNACDDSALKTGEWLDLIADRAGLPRPPRIARAEAAERIPAPLLSFMSESRRLVNKRIKEQLGARLRYPTVFDGTAMPVIPLGQ